MELKLKSYNLIEGTDGFKSLAFDYDEYEISFIVTKDETTMRVEDGIPIDVVKQAIKIVESGTLQIEL